jgi:hypothetical protein
MSCQDPAASIEARFVEQLGGLHKFGFVATQLALSYELRGAHETMLFEARPIGGE